MSVSCLLFNEFILFRNTKLMVWVYFILIFYLSCSKAFIVRRLENRNEAYIYFSRWSTLVQFELDSNLRAPTCKSRALQL